MAWTAKGTISGGGGSVSAPPKVDIFGTPGSFTWTKPTDASVVEVFCIGAGGGGGSGRRDVAGVIRIGGSGGGGGGVSWQLFPNQHFYSFPAYALPNSVPLTVGMGGAGALGVSATVGDGNGGSVGGTSFFGSSVTSCYCLALGGGGGLGGQQFAVGSVGGGGVGITNGGNGAPALSTGLTPSYLTTASAIVPTGGGGGAGITSADVPYVGGIGGALSFLGSDGILAKNGFGGAGGDKSLTAAASPGAAGRSLGILYGLPWPGLGGGGGGASNVGAGGDGGVGGSYGGGGGGGAASVSTSAPGKGGDGGPGCVAVVTYF